MILVFGQSGQVARELGLLSDEVVLLGRHAVDLRDSEACAAAILEHRPSAVINAAAWTAVDAAEEHEAEALAVNGAAPTAMAGAAAQLAIPFVHISTDYVFDGAGDAPFSPMDSVAPVGAYGRSKLSGEDGVRAVAGCYAILRTSWVFSAHGSNFVKTMLRLSETHSALRVVNDQIGGPTSARAIAQACLTVAHALMSDPGKAGTYHFAGAPDVSWHGFAEAIFAAAQRQVEVAGIASVEYPTPAVRPLNSRLNCQSTQATFGIARPDWRVDLQDVLEQLNVQKGPVA